MLKIYLNKANENWILDRFRKDWYDDNSDISSKSIYFSNMVWICSPWTWHKISKWQLKKNKVVCSIYHIDESKFNNTEFVDFKERDKYVHSYIAASRNTEKQLKKYTDKEIKSFPNWIDPELWFEIKEKQLLKQKYKLPEDKFIIGSFQRDTEGSDLISPKLSKGPDQFIKIVKEMRKEKNIHVLLAGLRRQYVIKELENLKIPYSYFEMVNQNVLNDLYNCLDLYVVASRFEGGPQAIYECAITRTPIISTNVGIAEEILAPESIYNLDNFLKAKPNTKFAYEQVQKFIKPQGYESFRSYFMEIYEN